MQKESQLASVTVDHQQLDAEQHNTATYLSDKLRVQCNNANCAIVCGSTIAYQNHAYTGANMDAAATQFKQDHNGIITQVLQVTADGLGDDPHDEEQNMATRNAAVSVCQQFCDKNSEDSLATVFQRANKTSYFKQRRGEAALVSAQVSVSPEGTRCKISSVGDCALFILDGTNYRVKHSLLPKVGACGLNAWTPISIQQLLRLQKKQQPLNSCDIEHDVAVAAGDIIIQMSDGLWAEFELSAVHTYQQDGEVWMEYQIDEQWLQRLVNDQVALAPGQTKNLSYAIAHGLTSYCVEKSLEKRREFLTITQQIKPYLPDEKSQDTVGQWLESIADKKLAENFSHFLFDSEHDGVCFEQDTPARYLNNWLAQYTFGDCTTLSVMQIPDFKVELMRSVLEAKRPTMRQKMLLKRYFSNKNEALSALSILTNECHTANDRLQQQVTFSYIYVADQIKRARRHLDKIFARPVINFGLLTVHQHTQVNNSEEKLVFAANDQ